MITRTPLRADVHRELLTQLLQGTLMPGSRLKDTEIAERLGVSRTPVREALLRLEREGFIAAHMGQGFRVRPLSQREVEEVYPLISLLERQAVATLGKPTEDQLKRLEALAVSMGEAADDPIRRIELDMAWHRALLEGCPNQHLFRILDELKGILFRYECTYMQVTRWVSRSVTEHRTLAKALETGDLKKLIRLLDNHWRKSLEAILSKFESQADAAPSPMRRSARPSSRTARPADRR